MAKTLHVNYEGATYTLEYTRETIALMEKQGFRIQDVEDKPISTLPVLFAGAFLAHHRKIKGGVISKIFEKITDKPGLIDKLGEMYAEPLETLFDDPEDDEGNATWGADF